MEGKENQNSVSLNNAKDKADQRRKQLEEYKKAKQAKKELEKGKDSNKSNFATRNTKPVSSKVEKVINEDKIIPTSTPSPKNQREEITEIPSEPNVDVVIATPTASIQAENVPKELMQTSKDGCSHYKIDWNMPVFLKVGNGKLQRLSRPCMRLFRLSNIEKISSEAFGDDEDKKLLISIMLHVVGCSGQPTKLDNRYKVKYWQMLLRVNDNILLKQQILLQASHFLSSEAIKELQNLHPAALLQRTPSRPAITAATSPLTPELQISIQNSMVYMNTAALKTPELEDEETLKMQAEIEDVVQRTPAIQDTPSKMPRTTVLREAMSAIKETSLYRKLDFGSHSKQKSSPASTLLEGGSAYLYALITPGKRLRTMLETETAVSPVRRSRRLLTRHPIGEDDDRLYENIDQIPDLASHGYIPNMNISTMTLQRPGPKAKEDHVSSEENKDLNPYCDEFQHQSQ